MLVVVVLNLNAHADPNQGGTHRDDGDSTRRQYTKWLLLVAMDGPPEAEDEQCAAGGGGYLSDIR